VVTRPHVITCPHVVTRPHVAAPVIIGACFLLFSTKSRDWLGRTSPKWHNYCV